jgi:hypothetical protein
MQEGNLKNLDAIEQVPMPIENGVAGTRLRFPALALPGLLLLVLLGAGGLMAGWLAEAPPAQVQMAGYSTSL